MNESLSLLNKKPFNLFKLTLTILHSLTILVMLILKKTKEAELIKLSLHLLVQII